MGGGILDKVAVVMLGGFVVVVVVVVVVLEGGGEGLGAEVGRDSVMVRWWLWW